MLTRKQHQLLLFIYEQMQQTGISPSYDEMKEALDLASKSGIHRLITALEERGFIRRLPNRARALEVIRLPDSTPAQADETNRQPQTVAQTAAHSRRPAGRKPPVDMDGAANINVPVMGRIAAGVPISAIQHQTQTLSLPADMIGSGEHYALEVKGDSMIDAGIFDGDTVIIRRTGSAHPGEIIVALVDDEEATLKRYRRAGNIIMLEAENPAYETRRLSPDRVKIQGRLVGLLRRY